MFLVPLWLKAQALATFRKPKGESSRFFRVILKRHTEIQTKTMFDYIFYKIKDKVNFENNEEQAEKMIEAAVEWSMSAGNLPIPIADLVAVTALQVDLVRQLAGIYEVSILDGKLESWIDTLSGSILANIGSDFIKTIPGLGKIVGGDSMSILAGASTYAIGHVFAKHLERRGTMKNFKAEEYQDYFDFMLEEGKEFARKLEAKKEKKQRYDEEFEKSKRKSQERRRKQGTEGRKRRPSENDDSRRQSQKRRRRSEFTDFEDFESSEENTKGKRNHEQQPDFEDIGFDDERIVADEETNFGNSNHTNSRTGKRPDAEKRKPKSAKNAEDPLERLKQLAEMRKSGVLTEEEFKVLKQKLMDEI